MQRKHATVLFIGFACLIACSTPALLPTVKPTFSLEIKPDEERAIAIVWQTMAEWSDEDANSRTPPMIGWYSGVAFPCQHGWCKGAYYKTYHLVLLAWNPHGDSYSKSSLSHELCHAWFDDGNEHLICRNNLPPVETANERLAKKGL